MRCELLVLILVRSSQTLPPMQELSSLMMQVSGALIFSQHLLVISESSVTIDSLNPLRTCGPIHEFELQSWLLFLVYGLLLQQ
jgi:hypothetical protein